MPARSIPTGAIKLAEGERKYPPSRQLIISRQAYAVHPALRGLGFELDERTGKVACLENDAVLAYLETHTVSFTTRTLVSDDPRSQQLEAVKRWYEHDWRRIEPKLRSTIVEGISVFMSLFDDNPALKRVFFPPKSCYDSVADADGRYGQPLPPFGGLLEAGRVCALNFPMAANPGLAKVIGTLMKQGFQRAVLERIPAISASPERHWREVLFLCDEYHAFATAGEDDPTGDEKFFSLSRQGKCIAMVTTQSLSSLGEDEIEDWMRSRVGVQSTRDARRRLPTEHLDRSRAGRVSR